MTEKEAIRMLADKLLNSKQQRRVMRNEKYRLL